MFEFAGKYTFGVHVTNFLDLKSTFQTCRMPGKNWEQFLDQKIWRAHWYPRPMINKLVLLCMISASSRSLASSSKTLLICFGKAWRPLMIWFLRSVKEMRSSESCRAIIMRATYWEVYAYRHTIRIYYRWILDEQTLVEATPTSGPALMWTPQWVSREIVEPTVLTTPMQSAPRSKQ